jgi:hypothetical protein
MAFFMKAFDVRIIGIDKLSCQAEGSRAYVCYVEEEYTSNMTGPQKVVKKYRFLKNAEGWFVRDVLESLTQRASNPMAVYSTQGLRRMQLCKLSPELR